MLTVTATVKVFIDVFIGVWAFILAYIWTNHINPRVGAPRARPIEIWGRFPKFILGFAATFLITLALMLGTTAGSSGQLAPAIGEANVLLDRRDVELPPALAGRLRQAGGGLSGVSVRVRRLGRVYHLVALLRRRQTAARILI
jgi:hypothetical protein